MHSPRSACCSTRRHQHKPRSLKYWRTNPRNRGGCPQPCHQRPGSVHRRNALGQIGGNAEQRYRRILDRHGPEQWPSVLTNARSEYKAVHGTAKSVELSPVECHGEGAHRGREIPFQSKYRRHDATTLVPPTASIWMSFSRSAWMTPIWASALAPPPDSTRPNPRSAIRRLARSISPRNEYGNAGSGLRPQPACGLPRHDRILPQQHQRQSALCAGRPSEPAPVRLRRLPRARYGRFAACRICVQGVGRCPLATGRNPSASRCRKTRPTSVPIFACRQR